MLVYLWPFIHIVGSQLYQPQRDERVRNFSRSYEKSKVKEDNDQLSKSSGFFKFGFTIMGALYSYYRATVIAAPKEGKRARFLKVS